MFTYRLPNYYLISVYKMIFGAEWKIAMHFVVFEKFRGWKLSPETIPTTWTPEAATNLHTKISHPSVPQNFSIVIILSF